MRFGPPTHFRTVQDNKELSGKYWHDMVERLIKTHGNTEIKRCGYTIRMYGGGPSHEPFFIGKVSATDGYLLSQYQANCSEEVSFRVRKRTR